MRKVFWGLSTLAAFTVLGACSDDKKDDGAPSCKAIIEACHPLDPGSGPIHECHEAAEADGVTEQTCAGKKAECLATCKPDGGT